MELHNAKKRAILVVMIKTRQAYLEDIGITFELLVADIQGQNDMDNFDINLLSETFFCKLLNIVMGLELLNINAEIGKNEIAIDLGDKKSKVSVQVTSENNKKKIKETVKKFEDNKKHIHYKKLYFLILDRKLAPSKKLLEDLKRSGSYSFDPATDIITVSSFLKKISALEDIDKIVSIHNYLLKELPIADFFKEEVVSDSIIEIIDVILAKDDKSTPTIYNRDFLNTKDKIKLNFKSEKDRETVTREYEISMRWLLAIDEILQHKYSGDDINVLQSSMYDLYNKHKNKNQDNIDIMNEMIDEVFLGSCKQAKSDAAVRLASKSLVMYHFEDCTVFERTAKEKNASAIGRA